MQKKPLKLKRSLTFSVWASKVMSFSPVNRNGWWIKFSVVNHSEILLIFTSMYTGQTILRYFNDEEKAVEFINYIIDFDPTEEINVAANP